jgi:hypothetical protein
MTTNPRHFTFATRPGGAAATISLTAILVLISGRAQVGVDDKTDQHIQVGLGGGF